MGSYGKVRQVGCIIIILKALEVPSRLIPLQLRLPLGASPNEVFCSRIGSKRRLPHLKQAGTCGELMSLTAALPEWI